VLHIYQTKGEIQKIIIDALMSLNRPSLETEVASWVWNRMLIDGIKSGVYKTVKTEMRSMRSDQVLRMQPTIGDGVGPYYVIHDPLTAIAICAN
jgi:hypothetical protein